jgi:hypothetical protein
MVSMTGSDPTRPAPSEEEPDASPSAEDPGYLTESGQAVGEDGSVVPIIGGLPAVEGSAWDIGAPLDERGAGLAEELGDPPGQAGDDDPGS